MLPGVRLWAGNAGWVIEYPVDTCEMFCWCLSSGLMKEVTVPIEDGYGDVLSKAARGLGMSVEALARKAGISENNAMAALEGYFETNTAERLAEALGLRFEALRALAKGEWYPEVPSVEGLARYVSEYFAMLVNAYLVWDAASGVAALFDTGADALPLLKKAECAGAKISQLFLTHAHGDHVADVERVVEATGASVWLAAGESFPGAQTFEHGREFSIGEMRVKTRRTSGHSPAGTTYVVEGLEKPVAIVGDAVFAGSMGGPKTSYEEALRTNLESIYSLPDETVLCPGHGPLTTVAFEKRWNPFYQPVSA